MDSCSVCMKLTLRAPIHAATAMLTATVTAMSMIEATTGLSAFLLFLKFFIFSFIPPFGIDEYVRREYQFKSYDLIHNILYVYNKTTRRLKNHKITLTTARKSNCAAAKQYSAQKPKLPNHQRTWEEALRSFLQTPSFYRTSSTDQFAHSWPNPTLRSQSFLHGMSRHSK